MDGVAVSTFTPSYKFRLIQLPIRQLKLEMDTLNSEELNWMDAVNTTLHTPDFAYKTINFTKQTLPALK
jgi:hypothetical protein